MIDSEILVNNLKEKVTKVVFEKNIDLLKLYDKLGTDTREKLFYWAIQDNHMDIIKMLINNHQINDLGKNDNYAFYCAAAHGHVEILKYFIDLNRELNINALNCRAFTIAAENNHIEVIKYLLTLPNLKPDITEAIYRAMDGEYIDIIKYLLSIEKYDISDEKLLKKLEWALTNQKEKSANILSQVIHIRRSKNLIQNCNEELKKELGL